MLFAYPRDSGSCLLAGALPKPCDRVIWQALRGFPESFLDLYQYCFTTYSVFPFFCKCSTIRSTAYSFVWTSELLTFLGVGKPCCNFDAFYSTPALRYFRLRDRRLELGLCVVRAWFRSSSLAFPLQSHFYRAIFAFFCGFNFRGWPSFSSNWCFSRRTFSVRVHRCCQ